MTQPPNRYSAIIAAIFARHHQPGLTTVDFRREDIVTVAQELGISLPKNIGDVLYSFRYRTDLPPSITQQAPEGYEWVIRPIGKAQYRFALVEKARIEPSRMLAETKILDATPGIIARYAISDEQGVLARLRYNRLIDIFTGVTCYSLQNHLRTTVRGIGQVETDELYVGVDRRGTHYVFPVQAKGGNDKLGIIQIEQDFAMYAQKFPGLICRPIAAQFADPSLIVLFAFEQTADGLRIAAERHYRLVDVEALTAEEIAVYQTRPD
ncbi:MAG: endonuclease [Caldilinea sp.]